MTTAARAAPAQLRCYVVVSPAVSTVASAPTSGIPRGFGVPLGHEWHAVLGRLRRSRIPRQSHAAAECFGRLTDRDEAVVKGLAASLACSTERGQDRW